MNRTALLSLAFALGAAVSASPLGPDSFGYTAYSVTAPFQDISATGTPILAYSDDDTLDVDLGFSFSLYGTAYTTVCASANGLMSFGGCEPSHSPVDVSTTPTFNDLPTAAVLWDDWQFYDPGDGAVYYQTTGAPGSQQFILQWNLARPYPSSPQPVTFEAILFEGANRIQYLYLETGSAAGASASVGIRDAGGDLNGRALSWSFQQAGIESGSAIEFAPGAVSEVPEPGTAALAALGLALVYCRARKSYHLG
jgi:hypothetical protein